MRRAGAFRNAILTAVLCAVAAGGSVYAASGDDGDRPNPDGLDPVRGYIDDGDYQAAIDELKDRKADDPQNADVLNLLGYSYRKAGDMEAAFENYQAALGVEPTHRGANEYIGELYLETDQLDKAEERLAVLDKECFFPCAEYTDLKAAIKAYKSDNGLD